MYDTGACLLGVGRPMVAKRYYAATVAKAGLLKAALALAINDFALIVDLAV